jgi:CcmD family protein
MDKFPFLFAGYTVVWVALFVYVYSLARKQKKLWEELRSLKEDRETRMSDP